MSSDRYEGVRSAMSGIDLKPDARGKVRDLYDLGDKLLLVASDRISAFDYILPDERRQIGRASCRERV